MPAEYLIATIILGCKVGLLLTGALLLRGSGWLQALGAGQRAGVDLTGFTVPFGRRVARSWPGFESVPSPQGRRRAGPTSSPRCLR